MRLRTPAVFAALLPSLLPVSVALATLAVSSEARAEKIHTGAGDTTARDSSDPYEDPDTTYYFLGARFRDTVMPNFLLSPFVAGGPTIVNVPSFGLEGSWRKGGTETIIGLSYADYGMDPFPFKGKNESEFAWELVKSNLKMIQLTADLLWGTEFSKQFQFQYGLATGIAFVFGDLHRVQAQPTDGQTAGDPNKYIPCTTPNSSAYCDGSNNHYPSGDPSNTDNWYTEQSWFSGGKRPSFYAIFGPEVALRYKPIHALVMRLDLGFNVFSGFFGGVAVNYGI
ncbi:MAG: hypothetical protein ACHREM_04515 [Polyangiales bacterium]